MENTNELVQEVPIFMELQEIIVYLNNLASENKLSGDEEMFERCVDAEMLVWRLISRLQRYADSTETKKRPIFLVD
jgi:hypothetical protein